METPDHNIQERAFIESVLRAEAAAVASIPEHLGGQVHDAIGLLVRCADAGGTIVVSGMGKSGLIGRKISATLASLAMPSHDVHPSEAMHGDLGKFREGDCAILLSFSGETEEVVALAEILRQDKIPIISITGGSGGSALARTADAALTLGVMSEASDLAMAPTCSTTATLALGDALALAAARRRSFSADDFARRHPGGTLGGLLRPVTDVLRFKGDSLAVLSDALTVREVLDQASTLGRRPGAIMLIDDQRVMTGLFTDGDLRRLIVMHPDKLGGPIAEVMTRDPMSLPETALVRDAVRLVRESRQDEIPIVDAEGHPVGLLDVQDLIAMKVVQG